MTKIIWIAIICMIAAEVITNELVYTYSGEHASWISQLVVSLFVLGVVFGIASLWEKKTGKKIKVDKELVEFFKRKNLTKTEKISLIIFILFVICLIISFMFFYELIR